MTDDRSDSTLMWVQDLLKQYESKLLSYARSLLGDRILAEEVVQETFLELWRCDRQKVEAHSAQWLYTVCRNRAISHQRKEGRMKAYLKATHDAEAVESETPSQQVEAQQSYALVRASVERLPPQQRELVTLKFNHQMSYRDISAITGLSESNVGYLLHMAIKALKLELQAHLAVGGTI